MIMNDGDDDDDDGDGDGDDDGNGDDDHDDDVISSLACPVYMFNSSLVQVQGVQVCRQRFPQFPDYVI